MPSSHGRPACLMLVSGDAPVPPLSPEISDVIGVRLHDAGGDRANADLGHELHADPRRRVRVLQVVNQLREVLDRIDVVMRRRADQADAGRRVADAGDVCRRPSCRQLAALAGLGALRHLDLQLVGVRRDTRSSRRSVREATCLIAERCESPFGSGRSARGLRPLRPCCSCRRAGSWRWRTSRAPRPTSSRSSSRPCRSA